MENLSPDISLSILSRLPIFSLFNCKLVSKSWRDLVKNPHLPHLHFLHQESQTNNNNNNSQNPCLLLHYSASSQDHLYFIDNCAELDEHDEGVLRKIKIPFKCHKFSCVLHCNGLLLLSYKEAVGCFENNQLCIFSPFTEQVVCISSYRQRFNENTTYGFGFDSRTREYKVVRISEFESVVGNFNSNNFELSLDQRIEVFTLGTELWRVKRGNNRFLLRMQPSEAFINGAIHWFGQIKHSYTHIILAFDLFDENFRQIPNPCCRFDESNSSLAVLGGCLSVLIQSEDKNHLGIWLMKKYGDRFSWTKEISIKLDILVENGFDCSVKPLCFSKNGKILIEYMNRELLCYDPDAMSCKRMEIHNLPTFFQAVSH